MKKSKKILGCIFSLLAFGVTLIFALSSEVYASEIDDYNYNLINFTGNKTAGSNSIRYNEDTYDYTYTHNYIESEWGSITLGTISLKAGEKIYIKSFSFVECGFGLETFINGERKTYEQSDELIDEYFTIEETAIFAIIVFSNPSKDNYTIENFTPYVGYYDINKYQPNLNYISDNSYNDGYNKGYQQGLLDNATTLLYKAFNGATVKLNYNDIVIMSDTINLTENDLYFSMKNITNIMTYLNEDETERYYSLSISLNSAINNELVVSLNNIILDTSLTLFNSLGGYKESFSRQESDLYTIIANSKGKYYDTIVYERLYPPDYIDFKLNLDLSQLTFQDGYNKGLDAGISSGYDKGYNKGYDKGYKDGKVDGYNSGYDNGSTSNIETNGLKTLFNSILSYPVNLISNVFNFEFMGINITNLIMFIISIGIVVFVVKKFRR